MSSNLDIFLQTLALEAESITSAMGKVSPDGLDELKKIFEDLKATEGQLLFCGVGKSYLIGQKLASTFTSLGLPSSHLHPTEALHGDLGRVRKKDAIVFISNSGTTEEIVKLLPHLSIEKNMRIGLLGNAQSLLAKECHIVFDCSVEREACLNNQAPTTSTTLALAMGDSMAVFYQKLVGHKKEDFLEYHPGGLLGKSLRLKIEKLMIPLESCPVVGPEANLKEALLAMTKYPLGICLVISHQENKLEGILVEGDIRRLLVQGNFDLNSKVESFINSSPLSVSSDDEALKVLKFMEERERPLNVLPVFHNEKIAGVIRLHDLLRFKK